MEVESLEGVRHVGVLFHPPIVHGEVLVDHLDPVQEVLPKVPHLGPLLSVEDVGLGRSGLVLFDEDLLDEILNLLNPWNDPPFEELPFEDLLHLFGQVEDHVGVLFSYGFKGLGDRIGDLLGVKNRVTTIPLLNKLF